MDFDKELKLKDDFTPPSLAEWQKVVEESLKGADFNKVMFTRTYEGITLKPIYTKADTADLPFTDNQPGTAPYLRGNSPQRFLSEGWLIAQSHEQPDLHKLNQELLSELMLGLTAVNLKLKHDDRQRGVSFKTIADLRTAFSGVDLLAAPLFMQLDITDHAILPLLEEYLIERKLDPKAIKAGIGFDPSSEFARKGYLSLPLEEVWEQVCKSVSWAVEKAPGIRCLSLDGSVYASAGASSTQELGFVLSTAIGYIQGLQMSGFSIDQIAPLFQVQLSLGSNFFMEIAKLRAFRLLWAEMIKAFGGNENSQRVWIHGQTASFNKSSYDIYVNVLRTSTEGFAGVIGGADSLEIGCFNELVAEPDESARRMARNQQIILKDEAHFGKVLDPAGGCYYIENLTNELAGQAWKLMQELEAGGGMIKSLRAGKIHQLLAETAKARIDAVNKRKDVFVGVNMYANLLEEDPLLREPEPALAPVKAVVLEQGALPRLRAVEGIEALRSRISASKKKPSIFLLNMGSLAEYKARADFSSGFFQVGGFEVISPAGFNTLEEAVQAARDSEASAFCLCSTDDNYQQLVPQICQALAGKTIILAGYPQDMVETYKQQGIALFIHIKADVLSTLSDLAKLLEVAL